MSRQDANAAFALTSFLYGANAAYIEDLYARYEADPKSVDAEWQAFFQSLKDDARDVPRARAAVVAAARLAARRNAANSSPRSTATGRNRQGGRRQGQGAGAEPKASKFPPPKSSGRPAIRCARSC